MPTCRVAEYTALQVKQAVTGHGKAAKEQVQDMVARLLSLPGLPGTDAADALGVAICHANSVDALALLGALAPAAAGLAHEARPSSRVGAWPSYIIHNIRNTR